MEYEEKADEEDFLAIKSKYVYEYNQIQQMNLDIGERELLALL